MTQKEHILNHLKVFKAITPLEALNRYGCLRIGARIMELRREGHSIRTRLNPIGKHYAVYELVEKGEDGNG